MSAKVERFRAGEYVEIPISDPQGKWVRYSDYEKLESRLAQVEKERDEARQKLMRRCSHPNTYPLKEATRRCHDCGAEILP